MKFAIYFDYCAQASKSFEYREMNAKNLYEAIEEADKMWNENDNPIYLARIMQKEGKIERKEGCKVETFRAVLCRRGYGWHTNTKENSETEHTIEKWTQKCSINTYVWFQ